MPATVTPVRFAKQVHTAADREGNLPCRLHQATLIAWRLTTSRRDDCKAPVQSRCHSAARLLATLDTPTHAKLTHASGGPMLQFRSRLGTWFTRPGPTATSCSGDPPKQVGLELHNVRWKLQVVVSSIPEFYLQLPQGKCRLQASSA